MSAWIARDKDGDLRIFDRKPTRDDEIFCGCDILKFSVTNGFYHDCNEVKINSEDYPEVTWENSPIELKPIIV